MELETEMRACRDHDWLYARPAGDLDLACAAELRQRLDDALRRSGCRFLWLDLQRVGFIDSSGLGVLLGRYRNLRPLGGAVRLSGASPTVYKLLAASGLSRLMEIELLQPSRLQPGRES